ncbi:MAG: protease pro-enzyme activation domain-containing protein [Terracidiphilus sp.]|jgi:subtilase family serine protease
MICNKKAAARFLAVAAFTLSVSFALQAQTKPMLVTQKIDNNTLVTLAGNTRPEAIADNDIGESDPSVQMDHMLLLLQRPPALEAQLEQFINDLHNPNSASYHKWLSAAQFGATYGPAQSDIDAVTSWLESQGLTVNTVYANNMFIDFSGTAGQIATAFHTDFHNYQVNGETHYANASDPQVPAALAGVVKGVLYLHNFKPHSFLVRRNEAHIDSKAGVFKPNYTAGSGIYPIVPWDLEKIYNIAPLLSAGISGQGVKMVVVEDTNQWNCASGAPGAASSASPTLCSATSDWAVFRNVLGLGRYTSGQFYEETPGTTTANTCTVPTTESGAPAGSGINSDDIEATIDVEWATSAAPNATIINAACASPRGGFGGLTAIQNILNHANADGVDVISMSYGESEESTGATLNAAFNSTFQQAVAAGIGIFVSSGDELAASSDGGGSTCAGLPAGTYPNGAFCAKDGITISGWMSSQYDVSVGGLDFADTAENQNSTYWGNNNVFYGSAKSYIMEQPWNDSCAGTILSNFITGSTVTYGSTGFCNTTTGLENFLLAVGGSGGPSACATGTAATRGVDGGTCAGYPKPTYQSSYLGSMAGLVNDNVRDTPDVALMAANGLWGHYYVVCYTDTTTTGVSNGGIASCTGTGVAPSAWPGYGGTSVSSPIMAAIQSLVVQHKGSLQGNPNPRYYALAAAEYGPSGNANCDSVLGRGVASSCIFYDVTLGDIDANCQAHSGATGLVNCYLPSGFVGVLSTSNASFSMAYPTTTGWDFGSGIGSVNAYNLVFQY